MKYQNIELRHMKIEEAYYIHFSLGFLLLFGLNILSRTFIGYPYSIPKLFVNICHDELVITNSILYGTNKYRFRISLRDPECKGARYNGGALVPYLIASYIKLGFDYESVTLLFGFMNVFSVVISFFYLSFNFDIRYSALSLFLFLFNGGPSLFKLFFYKFGSEIDLSHDVGRRIPIPWYNNFVVLVCFSKESAFSIALTLIFLDLYVNENGSIVLHAFIIYCIPNTCVFITCCIFIITRINYIRFTLIGLLLYGGPLSSGQILFKLYPLWIEQQMEGHFISQLVTVLEMLYIFIVGFFLVIFIPMTRLILSSHFSSLSCLVIMLLCRYGNSYFNNVVAIVALNYSILVLSTVKLYEILMKYVSREFIDIYRAGGWVIFLTIIIGGFISSNRTVNNMRIVTSGNAIAVSKWIADNTKSNSVFMCEQMKFFPTVFSGRQCFIGDTESVWRRGCDLSYNKKLLSDARDSSNSDLVISKVLDVDYMITSSGMVIDKAPVVNASGVIRVIRIK